MTEFSLGQAVRVTRGHHQDRVGLYNGKGPDGSYAVVFPGTFANAHFEHGDLDLALELARSPTIAIPAGQPATLTEDELLTMELYLKREGNLTPEQTVRLLAWAKFMRPLTEGPPHTRPYRGEF